MKILAVSDVESKYFFEYYTPGKLRDFDLIIACGDLRVPYLEFLVTMARCPLLYVHGNHDDRFPREPEGCVCIDDCLYEYQGLRILGLGGSYRYGKGRYMYTERQMRRRIHRLGFKLWRKKGFDVLVTHAPARGINDFDTIPHRGFECFAELLDRYRPRLFLHGHIHRNYGADIPRVTRRGDTEIVNAYEYTIVEL
ncbi:MAG: metallophosphoesterase family protein [Oscillospiraceae bacterium]|nr:metallophosphoesterase family protein [Oscillospiraceae bacterium]